MILSSIADREAKMIPCLDWSQRPGSLQYTITSAFESLVQQNSSNWGAYNGSSSYEIGDVKERDLIKRAIQQAPAGQKDFYVLDIGAGNFQWSKKLARFLDKQTDLPKDIQIHILGIRGEKYFGDRIVETDRCKIYNLGGFKIEEVFAAFKEQGLDLENKIDLAISRWCFRHLADPVGTFVQTYNLLRPQTGFFLTDGFYFLPKEGTLNTVDRNRLVTQLFIDTKAPFLTTYYDGSRSLNHFILRRPDAKPCELPMGYLSEVSVNRGRYQIGSECVTRFEREPQGEDAKDFCLPKYGKGAYGDKKMFDWFKENNLVFQGRRDFTWRPLREEDRIENTPLLHRAIQNEVSLEEVIRLLESGEMDINESDYKGRTALHIAIKKGAYDLFSLLMEKGADFRLSSRQRGAALQEAAAFDTEGRFLEALIRAGAEINEKFQYWAAPITCAIQRKNWKAIEILLAKGAKISKEDRDGLERFGFTLPD